MKILVVSHAYPPDGVGGTERYAEAVARGLAAQGHEVRVFTGSLEWRERFTVERMVAETAAVYERVAGTPHAADTARLSAGD